jgi:hypothetical protein
VGDKMKKLIQLIGALLVVGADGMDVRQFGLTDTKLNNVLGVFRNLPEDNSDLLNKVTAIKKYCYFQIERHFSKKGLSLFNLFSPQNSHEQNRSERLKCISALASLFSEQNNLTEAASEMVGQLFLIKECIGGYAGTQAEYLIALVAINNCDDQVWQDEVSYFLGNLKK